MSRTIFIAAGALSASSLLLIDSAVKGAALLTLAGVAVLLLRRDSAATRHLVWLLAIVATLAMPLLSAMLPQWRVLPDWASIPASTAVEASSRPSIVGPAVGPVELPLNAEPDDVGSRLADANDPAVMRPASMLDSPPALAMPDISAASENGNWQWLDALPLVWAIVFCVLILRLLTARWMLWSVERQATVLGTSAQPAESVDNPIVRAVEAASLELRVTRPITVLIHPRRTIPLVWGIFHCRLLLSAAAQHWSSEQLRSVLLHELAHVKRRDTAAQLLTQVACAVHWFNPLVWLAAWRLGVERERACDDLVLAHGVRPSAYAGHLLEVVSGVTSESWMPLCGVAMARESSLEGRLLAVLSQGRSRRSVSSALAGLALAIAVGVAVPVAMLGAADEEPASPQQQAPQKPTTRAKLAPDMEEKLQWGEPVGGLRAAVVIRHADDKPKPGDSPDLYLAIQNVSKNLVRLSDTDVPPKVSLRVLYLKSDGRTLMGLGAREPLLGDLLLQPHDVALLPMFSASKILDGQTTGSVIAEGALKDSHQTLVAELNIEHAPAGAWIGKLRTGETSASVAAGHPQPKTKEAKALFKLWQHHARGNGDIPGGLVSRLGDKVDEFIRNNTGDAAGDPYAKKMAPLVPRFDSTRDWKLEEAVTLLDDIAAVTTVPIDMMLDELAEYTIQTGAPLPPELAGAPRGEAQPNGLRLAWLLEPQAAEHRLGTPLKSRILIHNSGKDTIVFRTRTWHHGVHQASDADGSEIEVEATSWLTRAPLMPFRLAPGEFIELNATGVGVGAMNSSEDWQNTRVGSWIEAKSGDEVTLTTEPVPLAAWNEDPALLGEPRWWLDFITARLHRELPLPAGKDERERLLYRVAMDLFGTPLSAEDIGDFLVDRQPGALDSLAERLARRPGVIPFTGSLQSAPTKFRVLPPDPDAAKRPRTANNPGRYTLSDGAVLVVSRRPDGERIVNEASIQFYSADPTKPAPSEPVEIKLPDGNDTWSAGWLRGGNVLWVSQRGSIHSYDFTDPANVQKAILQQPADLEKVPKAIRDALRSEVVLSGPPASPR